MTDSKRDALLALAERCEAATGADRELDKAVYAAIGNCNHERTKYYCIEDGNDTDSGFTCLDCGADTYGAKSARAYTASLDAAVTLVPDSVDSGGERFRVEHWNTNGVHAEHIRASAWVAGAARVYAATPALALTAAALRARALSNEGVGL